MEYQKQERASGRYGDEPLESDNLWLLPDSLGKHPYLPAIAIVKMFCRFGFQFDVHLAVVEKREHFLVFRPLFVHLMRAEILCQHLLLGKACLACHELA